MMLFEYGFVFLVGAFGYGGIETVWRGYTHWTMLLLGGICLQLIYLISTRMHANLFHRWLACASVITTLEFLFGCFLNLQLGWNVWDYSRMPGNLLGQICPEFFVLWFLLSIPCSLLSMSIRKYLFSAGSPFKKRLHGQN